MPLYNLIVTTSIHWLKNRKFFFNDRVDEFSILIFVDLNNVIYKDDNSFLHYTKNINKNMLNNMLFNMFLLMLYNISVVKCISEVLSALHSK